MLVIGIPSGFAVGAFGWLGGGAVEVRFQRWLHKGLPRWFNAIGDEPAESRSVATVKLRNLALLEDNQALKGRQSTDGGERSVTPLNQFIY